MKSQNHDLLIHRLKEIREDLAKARIEFERARNRRDYLQRVAVALEERIGDIKNGQIEMEVEGKVI